MEMYERSKHSFIIKTQTQKYSITSLSPKQKSHRPHPKLPDLIEHEQTLFKLKPLKIRKQNNQNSKRCRSSESSYEGSLNKRNQFMFQTISYFGTYYQRHKFYVKKWKKLIIAIQSLMYILKMAIIQFNIRNSSPPKMMISHYSIHHHHYPQSPSNRKRNKSCSLDFQNSKISFGEKVQTLIILQKTKLDSIKSSGYLQQIKNQNTKLNRLLNQKAISLQSLHTTTENFKSLPFIQKIDNFERQPNLQKQTKKLSLKQKRLQ